MLWGLAHAAPALGRGCASGAVRYLDRATTLPAAGCDPGERETEPARDCPRRPALAAPAAAAKSLLLLLLLVRGKSSALMLRRTYGEGGHVLADSLSRRGVSLHCARDFASAPALPACARASCCSLLLVARGSRTRAVRACCLSPSSSLSVCLSRTFVARTCSRAAACSAESRAVAVLQSALRELCARALRQCARRAAALGPDVHAACERADFDYAHAYRLRQAFSLLRDVIK